MAPSKRFGQFLREGITSVAMRQGKTKGAVEQEIARELGYSPENVQRWQRGYVPKEAEQVRFLVRYCCAKGRVNRDWASSILQQADYPDPHSLLWELAGEPGSATLPKPEVPISKAVRDPLSWQSLVDRGQRQSERYLEVVKGGESGKYIPALYSSRTAIEHEIACFFESDRTGMAIIGEAGHGKTNLLCRMAEHWAQQGHAVYLYNCASLARPQVDQELAQDLSLPPASSFIQHAEAIGQRAFGAGKYFVVLFDAINEFRHEREPRAGDLLKNINSLIGRSGYPGIKVILTCRTPTWERLDILGDANLDWGLYYTPDGKNTPFSLGEFTDDEFRFAYSLYSSRFEIRSTFDSLSETTKERCHDPLILRLTASAYTGHEIPMNAPSLSVFQEYYDRVERRDDRRFLKLLVADMWERETTSLTHDDLLDHPKMGAEVALAADSAYERLKDLGVLMETEEDFAVRFTYERFFEYMLCLHLLSAQKTITPSYVAQRLDRVSEFPSSWGAAQFAVSLSKNTKKLIVELSDSVDYMTRQFVLETILLEYQDKPQEVIGWLREMVRSESELTRHVALNAAYQIGSEAKSVFVEGASGAAEDTRETVANYVLLLWRQDPDMGLDILQSLIDHLGFATLRSAPNTLRSVLKIAFLFHTNCWDKRRVWRISEIETSAYRKIGITSPSLLASPAGKIVEGVAKEGLGRIVLGIFRSVTGSTTAQDERASFKAALELPQEGRDRIERIIPYLNPSCRDVEEISGDLEYLLQMRLGLAAVLSLGVLGVQLQSNYERTRRLLLDLFERSDDAGRFILTVPLVNLTFPTTSDYHRLALQLHERMYQESPGGFFGDPWGTGTYLDVTITTGIVCCLHTNRLDTHLWLVERAAETGDDRLLKKCISSLAVLGFFFPEQALQIIFESDIDPSSPVIKGELIQSLAAMRTIHAEQVDRALVRAHMPSDFVRRVLATQEPTLIRVCVDAISLLTWVVHYATHSARAREFITFFAMQIAQARSPEDVRKPVTDLWWRRVVDGNFGLVRAVVDKDYFAEFEGTTEDSPCVQ